MKYLTNLSTTTANASNMKIIEGVNKPTEELKDKDVSQCLTGALKNIEEDDWVCGECIFCDVCPNSRER